MSYRHEEACQNYIVQDLTYIDLASRDCVVTLGSKTLEGTAPDVFARIWEGELLGCTPNAFVRASIMEVFDSGNVIGTHHDQKRG